MGNIFPVSHILQSISRAFRSDIKVIYEKREKYLPVLHKTTCDNYFTVKCLLKSNEARVKISDLLIATNMLKII